MATYDIIFMYYDIFQMSKDGTFLVVWNFNQTNCKHIGWGGREVCIFPALEIRRPHCACCPLPTRKFKVAAHQLSLPWYISNYSGVRREGLASGRGESGAGPWPGRQRVWAAWGTKGCKVSAASWHRYLPFARTTWRAWAVQGTKGDKENARSRNKERRERGRQEE